MLAFSRRTRRAATLVLVTLLAASPALLAQARREPPGADSPQALVARLEKASQKGDLPEIAACLTPDDRTDLTKGMLLAATMMVAFSQMGTEMAGSLAEGMAEATGQEMNQKDKAEMEKQKKEAAQQAKKLEDKFRGILTKHKLPDFFAEGDQAGDAGDMGKADEQLKKIDQVALLADLMTFLHEIDPDEATKSGKPIEALDQVTGYKIDGNRATAKAGDETLEFVKLDGRWYLEAPEKKEAAPVTQ